MTDHRRPAAPPARRMAGSRCWPAPASCHPAARRSPGAMLSPTFFTQALMLPCVMVGLSAGMPISSCAGKEPPLPREGLGAAAGAAAAAAGAALAAAGQGRAGRRRRGVVVVRTEGVEGAPWPGRRRAGWGWAGRRHAATAAIPGLPACPCVPVHARPVARACRPPAALTACAWRVAGKSAHIPGLLHQHSHRRANWDVLAACMARPQQQPAVEEAMQGGAVPP
jgi:hypothetical protein